MSPLFCTHTDNRLCHLHQINGGNEEVEIIENSATATFEATGPDEDNVWTEFSIELQQRDPTRPPYIDLQTVSSCNAASPELTPFGVLCSFDVGKFGNSKLYVHVHNYHVSNRAIIHIVHDVF